MSTPPIRAPSRPTLARAQGLHVWDAHGRRYLDATSGAFCMQLGYTRPDLVQAMAETAGRLPHARPSAFESEESEAYRAALLRAAGPPFSRVILTSSGSEAVEVAVKAAWWYQRASGRIDRTRIHTLRGHYHGSTITALDLTGWSARRRHFDDFLGERAFGPPATCARCERGHAHRGCDVAGGGGALERIEGSAAFLAESIPGAGLAAAAPPPGWPARARARCDEADALWIADEVLSGFGRAGALFAWTRLAARVDAQGGTPDRSAVPDLVVFGKGAGAGFAPLAGVLVSEKVARALEGFAHVQTYGGNPVACAVGMRALRAYQEEAVFEGAARSEPDVRSALADLERHPAVLEVRGMGALWGLELARPGEGRPAFAPSDAAAKRVMAACRGRGVLVHASTGFDADGAGDAIVLAPPLTAEASVWVAIAAALRGALDVIAPRADGTRWVEEWEDR